MPPDTTVTVGKSHRSDQPIVICMGEAITLDILKGRPQTVFWSVTMSAEAAQQFVNDVQMYIDRHEVFSGK